MCKKSLIVIPSSLILFLMFTTCYLIFPTEVSASSFSASVYPPTIKINAIPPVSLKSPIIISNLTDQTQTFNISFKLFTQSDQENGQVRYLKSDELNLKDPLILQRIKIFDQDQEVSSVEIAPRQKKELSLRIDIPDGETVSDYYFSLLFTSSAPSVQSQQNKSNILTAIATNVLLSIGPKIKPMGEISDFSTPLFKPRGPVKFYLKAANLGNQFILLRGYILITNVFGQTVGRIDLGQVNILAGSSRNISAVWPETFLLGPYTATLNLTFSDHGPTLTQSTHFIGAPLQVAVVSLIVIGLILFIKRRLKPHLEK